MQPSHSHVHLFNAAPVPNDLSGLVLRRAILNLLFSILYRQESRTQLRQNGEFEAQVVDFNQFTELNGYRKLR
jgi:hypothetical protein